MLTVCMKTCKGIRGVVEEPASKVPSKTSDLDGVNYNLPHLTPCCICTTHWTGRLHVQSFLYASSENTCVRLERAIRRVADLLSTKHMSTTNGRGLDDLLEADRTV